LCLIIFNITPSTFISLYHHNISDLPIYSGPSNGTHSVLLEGESFNVLCRLTPFETTKWQKDGVQIVPSSDNNITLDEWTSPDGGRTSQLYVPQANVRHSGRYRCSSFHKEGHQVFVVSGTPVCCRRIMKCLQPEVKLKITTYDFFHPFRFLTLRQL
jgi:hypothetical protein